ncbi:polyprenyl synthetase family protein [Zongyangia hominis]|uniref:Farnesyl diphosphate synthase n=1 Tax=Zongyangia hominis TaxID=2763677 RepID=A0A926IAY5_9FIRM|nr:farnesyl diphosphate synthase [Zongyangia hominis]MBC8569597.1 polyprenyl synthetase family protein [Zongyangia hominis]
MNFLEERLKEYGTQIDQALISYLPGEDCLQKSVMQAMKYSAMAGGKRIRPVLTMEFCRQCGGEAEDALPFACAVEMIHSYSLIHDDLPCMDDDDMRRGKPSCHVQFGEAMALLAGDGLLTLAFGTLAKADAKKVGSEQIARAVGVLAEAAGVCGMIGGQVIDLESEGQPVDLDHIRQMHALKTGALIKASTQLGVLAGRGSEDQLALAQQYAEKIGLAFQIVDDMLDVTSSPEVLGKPVGSDRENEKTTFVTLLGLSEAQAEVKRLSSQAKGILDAWGTSDRFLYEVTDMLANRQK